MGFIRRSILASVGLSLMSVAAIAQDYPSDRMLDVKRMPYAGPAEVDEQYLKSIDEEMKRLGIVVRPSDEGCKRARQIGHDGSLIPGVAEHHGGSVTLYARGIIPYPADSMMVKILVSGTRESGMSAYEAGIQISDRMMDTIRGDTAGTNVANVSRSAVMTEPDLERPDRSSHKFRVEIIAPVRSVRAVESFGKAVPSIDRLSISEPFLNMDDIPVEIFEQSLRDALASMEEKSVVLEDLTGLEYSLRSNLTIDSQIVFDYDALDRAYMVTDVRARYGVDRNDE